LHAETHLFQTICDQVLKFVWWELPKSVQVFKKPRKLFG